MLFTPSPDASIFETEYALSEIFDFGYEAALKKKYVILSSPRSGSTMLASALYNTNLAGVPFEYFHENLLKFRDSPELRPNELNLYLEEMMRRRTSPNGYFGMKLQFDQFNYLFGANPVAAQIGIQFIRDFEKRIFVYRRDKILLAISRLLSREKRIWSQTETENFEPMGREFVIEDASLLTELIKFYIDAEQSWRKVLATAGEDYIEVAYEDMCEKPFSEFSKVCRYLDIDYNGSKGPNFSTKKEIDIALTNKIKNSYLKFIGS